FTAWKPPADKKAEKQKGPIRLLTQAMSGQLRLLRTGSVLLYFAAEGASNEFALIKQVNYGTEDLKYIRIIGTTGGIDAFVDVHVIELRVRAESLSDVTTTPVTAPSFRKGDAAKWVGIFLGSVAIALPLLGLLVYRRKCRGAHPNHR